MKLRPYQTETVADVRTHFRAGKRAACVVLPTGAGKTITAVSIVQSAFAKQSKVLWVVHRWELISQAAEALRKNHVPCGIISPRAPRTYEAVQVASIQTLIARDHRPEANIIIFDECHHLMADTYLQVRRDYPNAHVIGLTATPGRADGRGLAGAFDCLVARVQPRELIALNAFEPSQGLVPVTVIGPRTEVKNLCDYPVDAYRADCAGRPAIAFVGSVKEAERLAEAFSVAGIPSRSIDGTMSGDDRLRFVDDFRAGKFLVGVSVQVLTEGFDYPEVSAVILASRCGSEINYVQKTGRGMRPAPWAGKRNCIVLDLLGSSHTLHILPDSDRAYSLEGHAVRRSVSGELIDMPQCPRCGTCFECGMWSGGPCPKCGWVRAPKRNPAVVRQEKIELRENQLTRSPSMQSQVRWLQEELTKQHGRTGGLLIRFKRAFGRFPFAPQREQSGFNECLKREKAEREHQAATREPLLTRRTA